MKNKISIIVGGTGQLGISLAKLLLKKNYKVFITTRNLKLAKKKVPFTHKNLKLKKLNILDVKEIKNLINKINPNQIFYFAGQSSPLLSFRANKITYSSNFEGCKNFLEVIFKIKSKCKFVNASSSEIFAENKIKLVVSSKKIPVSPYGKAKLLSFNHTKFYRNAKKLNAYNAIIFNTESYYRDKNYLIPKICMAAINAKKYNKKTTFGNLKISREWNWASEQMFYLLKFIKKDPQDFILSNGKSYSALKMIEFAFKYFKLNYKNFIQSNKKFERKRDFLKKESNFTSCLKRNNLKRDSKIYGKNLINRLIKYYLHEENK